MLQQSHHSEFYDLFDRGGIQVGQPDVGRVGGLMECLQVCDMAADRERIIVPHCWKTGASHVQTLMYCHSLIAPGAGDSLFAVGR